MRLGKFRSKAIPGDWQIVARYIVLFGGAAALLGWRLGSLPGGYSGAELQTFQDSLSWPGIFHQPLHAPFLAAIHALSYIFGDSLLLGRLVAAACGLITLILFYALVHYWHGERASIFGTIVFGTSAWFLHTARLGTPDVLLFGMVALTTWYTWLKHTSSPWAVLVGFLLTGVLLYEPGMVWLIALGLIWQWKAIDRHFKRNLWAVTLGGVLLLGALVPIGLAIYHNPEVAKAYAGLPAVGWPMPLEVVQRLAQVPLHLFVRAQADPLHWLGRVPIIDLFTAAMFFLGGYLYIRHIKLRRFWLVASTLLIGAALVSLGGEVTLTFIVPFIYLVAAAGIGCMFDRWLTVFPRNVIAQSVGYCLMSIAVLATCIYSFRHYYIAWPQALATKHVFTIKEPSASVTMKE